MMSRERSSDLVFSLENNYWLCCLLSNGSTIICKDAFVQICLPNITSILRTAGLIKRKNVNKKHRDETKIIQGSNMKSLKRCRMPPHFSFRFCVEACIQGSRPS